MLQTMPFAARWTQSYGQVYFNVGQGDQHVVDSYAWTHHYNNPNAPAYADGFHGADDFAIRALRLKAMVDGEIIINGWVADYEALGLIVAVRDQEGYTWLRAHCAATLGAIGQKVRRTDDVAVSGHSGQPQPPDHLHLELYPPGVDLSTRHQRINPYPWLLRFLKEGPDLTKDEVTKLYVDLSKGYLIPALQGHPNSVFQISPNLSDKADRPK